MKKRLTLTLFLLPFFLTACGEEVSEPYAVYRVDEYSLPERFSLEGAVEFSDGRVYLPGTQIAPILLADDVETLHSFNLDGSEPRSEPYESSLELGMLRQAAHSDGVTYYVEDSVREDGSRTVCIRFGETSLDCSELYGFDVSKLRENPDGTGGFEVHAIDSDGATLTVAATVGAAEIDLASGEIQTLLTERELLAAEISEGELLALMRGERELPASAVEISLDSGTVTPLYDLAEGLTDDLICALVRGGELILVTRDGISRLDSSGKSELIVDFVQSGVLGSGVAGAAVAEEGFILTERDSLNQVWRVLRLSPIPEADRVEKRELTVGVTSSDERLTHAAVMFVRENPEFTVRFVELDSDETRLAASLASGEMPDVIYFGSDDRLFRSLAAKGAFLALGELESLLTDCANSSGSISGRLYGVPTGLRLTTCVAKAGVFDGRMTLDSALDLIESGEPLTNHLYSNNLTKLLQYDILSFTDAESGETDFASERFVRYARLWRELHERLLAVDKSSSLSYRLSDIGEGSALAMLGVDVNSLDTAALKAGCELDVVGWPNASGSGCIAEAVGILAVNAKSAHPEAALELVKRRISDEYLTDPSSRLVTESAIAAHFAELRATHRYYVYASGVAVTSATPFTEERLKQLGAGELLDPAESERLLREAIASARTPDPIEAELADIVLEELSAFAGSEHLTAEEVARIIDDRAGKLYAEKR